VVHDLHDVQREKCSSAGGAILRTTSYTPSNILGLHVRETGDTHIESHANDVPHASIGHGVKEWEMGGGAICHPIGGIILPGSLWRAQRVHRNGAI